MSGGYRCNVEESWAGDEEHDGKMDEKSKYLRVGRSAEW